jgi:FKBP-type peptidyl-prolyl cis-trans isomerase 2
MKKVQNGDTVVVNYTGRLEDGTVFDSSLTEGREPLKAQLGQGLLIKGFEDGIIEMTIGDKKTIEIDPSNAYGNVNSEMIVEVPREQIPEGISVGDMLQAEGPMGPVNVKVAEIKESTIVVDANHPLAGQKLIFDLELVSID